MNKNFEKWAKGYSGFDGGNPEGKIWLCGIEWGGKSPLCIKEIEKLFLEDVTEIPTGYDCHETNLQFDYNKRFIHIIGAMKDIEFPKEDKKLIENKIKELNDEEKFFTKNSNYLKLNLSPFNFPTTDSEHWKEYYHEITGYETKAEYEKWVWEKRKILFNDMVKDNSPRLIITFGADKKKKYTEKYQDFFGFSDEELKCKKYESDKRLVLRYAYKKNKKGNDILFVNTYFPSNGWLTSVKALNETGKIIKELLDEKGINIDLDN